MPLYMNGDNCSVFSKLIVEGGNSGGNITPDSSSASLIEVINKTGEVINEGDKVWLNENQQTAGSSYAISGTNNLNQSKMGIIDRTGQFGYFNNNYYNISDDSATSLSSTTALIYGLVYMANGSLISHKSRIDGIAQWSTTYYPVNGSDDLFITDRGTQVVRLDMTDGTVIKTFSNSSEMVTNNPVKVGNYIYRLYGSNSSANYKWFIDEENSIVSRQSYTITNSPTTYDIVGVGVTNDDKYIIGTNYTAYSSGNAGCDLYILEVLDNGNLRGIVPSEVPEDMQKWFTTKCVMNFNKYTGLLSVCSISGRDYGFYKYENGQWTTLNIDLRISEIQSFIGGALTISDDLSRACYNCNYPDAPNPAYREAIITNITSINGYSSVPYRYYNITKDTITGKAMTSAELDGTFTVATVL